MKTLTHVGQGENLLFKCLSVFILFATFFLFSVPAQAKDGNDFRYEIEGAGTGSQGTYLIKVSVMSKKATISEDEIARCAVHGVLFRGFSSKANRQGQKPLAGSALAEQQHRDFFHDFFQSTFRNYVQSIEGSRQVTKVGKEYRISTIVTVAKDLLRKDLQNQGIIKGLNTGF